MSSKNTTNLEWALTYPVDLSARSVLVALTTVANSRTVEINATGLAAILKIPKRTAEDALKRLVKAKAIKGKRGKYKLQFPSIRTPVKRKRKLKPKEHKQLPLSVDTPPVFWVILEALAIDKRKGHVGLKPENLPKMQTWLKEKGVTLDEAEDAADKIAARWPINNQRVVFRIFYTYCRYQIRDRERNNANSRLRNARSGVHARRVGPGGISDPFKDFASAENG